MEPILNIVLMAILTMCMIGLMLYVFFTSKACTNNNISKVSRGLVFLGYLLFIITVLYTLIKAIKHGFLTANYYTIIILVISLLLTITGIVIGKMYDFKNQ